MASRSGLLFDTQALLAWSRDDVPKKLISAVTNGHPVVVSYVSLWEFILKHRSHRFEISFEDLRQVILVLKAELLGIEIQHLNTLQTLPFLETPKKHADPFDRLLIAQAVSEQLVLVGKDAVFPAYAKLLDNRLQVMWK